MAWHGGLRWWDSIQHELNNDLEDMIFISSILLFMRGNLGTSIATKNLLVGCHKWLYSNSLNCYLELTIER